MGHTLVAHFEDADFEPVRSAFEQVGLDRACHIPFGRNCDRSAANAALPHHVTLFHWSKQFDWLYLPRLNDCSFSPCRVQIIGSSLMHAEEGSLLLYFDVLPDKGFCELTAHLEETLGLPSPFFLHMTLAVDTDHEKILMLRRRLDETLCYPFTLNVTSMGLYHIWTPTYPVRRFA